MSIWNPWRGCIRYSEGCKYCYIHMGDMKRGIDTANITKTKDFDKPIIRNRNGNYKMKSGLVNLCFSSDFFIDKADKWRHECWKMIKERDDCIFLFLTKRIDRFYYCIPDDWGEGYENVVICCTVENQANADYRLSILKDAPIRHKCIILQPLIEEVSIDKYLDGIDLVVVGGESNNHARPLNYDWVLKIRESCICHNVDFEFRQCGTYTIKDNKMYKIPVNKLMSQAYKAGINCSKNKTIRFYNYK